MAKSNGNKGKGFLALFFCIPLAFILYFLITYSSQSVTTRNVDKITVTIGDVANEFKGESDIKFFVDMLTRSRSIKSAMRDVSGEKPVLIACDRKDKTIEYKLYPSLNFSGCLLVGPEGEMFALETETAKQMLLRDEFEYMYSDYFLPSLSVVSGDQKSSVLPINSDWKYYKSDGNLYSYSPEKFSDGKSVVSIRKGFDNALVFTPNGEKRPYEMKITCESENGMKYEISDISQLDLSVDTLLSVKVESEWPLSGGAEAYGKASYEFKLLYDIPAIVEVPNTEVAAGGFIEVHATHLNADELVELKTGDKTYQLKFGIVKEDKGVALLPVALGTEAGEYDVEIVAGINVINETITVKPNANLSEKFLNVSSEDYDSDLSPEIMEGIEKVLSGAVKERPEENYFAYGDAKLHAPVKGTTKVTFGTTVHIGRMNNETGKYEATEAEQICNGVVYETAAGATVTSAQAGKVVYVGNLSATGNTVIVYHGYGIYTYYYHLDKVDVQTGFILGDKEVIGIAGQSGFTDGKNSLQFCVSIDGVFVDPTEFLK